jgi:DNA-binding MarR family transcriptional regulator
MPTRPTSIRAELKQSRPFPTPAQEAAVGLLRTADVLRRALTEAVAPSGITHQQYNVLRILRGSDPEPLPTLEIAERMIEEAPGITRLLDRLEAKGLVRRERCRDDRRQVLCWISPAGLALLSGLDPVVEEATATGGRALGRRELRGLIALLDRLRTAYRPAGNG